MPIDTSDPDSPGGMMKMLSNKLSADYPRMERLQNYWLGLPSLPAAAEGWTESFRHFIRVARSNFASAIVQAPRDRLAVRAFFTSAAGDDNGDDAAWDRWTENDLELFQSDLYLKMLVMGRSYTMCGQVIDPVTGDKTSYATVEDPRQFITEQDPVRQQVTRAAYKAFHDPISRRDYAALWVKGKMYLAYRQLKSARIAPPAPAGYVGAPQPIRVTFAGGGWDWMGPAVDGEPNAPGVDDLGFPVPFEVYDGDIPVALFENRDGMGEFEAHIDVLDRINHMILQRLVIATMQAFRQRAIEQPDPSGLGEDKLPLKDSEGKPIDYDDIFKASPSALWKLPPGAKIWESQQADIQGILAATKDDVLHLAGITATPLSMFSPDAVTQSAEGAALTKEGQTYKVENLQRICGRGWARTMSHLFRLGGDVARAELKGISVDWHPAQHYSLAEMASADSLAASLPAEVKWVLIWGMTPNQVKRAKTAQQDEMVLAQTMALTAAANAPAPGTAPGYKTPAAIANAKPGGAKPAIAPKVSRAAAAK